MDPNEVDMLLDAGEEIEAHWEQWMGGSAFKLGDDTTDVQFSGDMDDLHLAGLATAKAADFLELADAHEKELAAKLKKKILAYPTAVENAKGKDSEELAHCPYLAHQRKRRARRGTGTTGGTTEGLPTDIN